MTLDPVPYLHGKILYEILHGEKGFPKSDVSYPYELFKSGYIPVREMYDYLCSILPSAAQSGDVDQAIHKLASSKCFEVILDRVAGNWVRFHFDKLDSTFTEAKAPGGILDRAYSMGDDFFYKAFSKLYGEHWQYKWQSWSPIDDDHGWQQGDDEIAALLNGYARPSAENSAPSIESSNAKNSARPPQPIENKPFDWTKWGTIIAGISLLVAIFALVLR